MWLDTHVAKESVVDRAGRIGDVEVVDIDGQRARLARNRAMIGDVLILRLKSEINAQDKDAGLHVSLRAT